MGTGFCLRVPLLTFGSISLLFLVAACGEAASSREIFSGPQLLTQIEAICLDQAEDVRDEFRQNYQCDAQCYAELTLVDVAICACQRQRLKRDFSAEDLHRISVFAKTDASQKALREEGVKDDSPLMFDNDFARAEALKGLSMQKLTQLGGAYSEAEAICREEETAKSIVRSR